MSKKSESRTAPEFVAAAVKAVVLVGMIGLVGLAAVHGDVASPEASAKPMAAPAGAQGIPAETRSVPAA
jgi:hypothetical protein